MTTATVQAAYMEHLLFVLSQVTAALEAAPHAGLQRLRADTLAALQQAQAGQMDPAQPWGGCR